MVHGSGSAVSLVTPVPSGPRQPGQFPARAAVVRVKFPDVVAAVPLLFTKEPLMVNNSAVVNPFKSIKVPALMLVNVVVPNAASLPNLTVPPVIVVAPLYVFAPDKVHVPASFFSKVPVPLITPDAVTFPVPPIIAAVVSVISPKVVAAVALLLTKDPLMVNNSAVVNPFKSTIAPDAIVVAPTVLPNPRSLPNLKVPADTVIAASCEEDPDKTNVPAPDLIKVAAVDIEEVISPEKVVEVPEIFMVEEPSFI